MEVLKMEKKKYFYGQEISEYGIEHNRVDYRTLSKCFDMVLNNNIINSGDCYEEWQIVNGCDYIEEEDEYIEVFQYYIISEEGAEILKHYTNEIVYYNSKFDMYLWGVTHWGTAWGHVLTDIKINKNED
jgi:hypothetical protein